jgi:hypothetical protein
LPGPTASETPDSAPPEMRRPRRGVRLLGKAVALVSAALLAFACLFFLTYSLDSILFGRAGAHYRQAVPFYMVNALLHAAVALVLGAVAFRARSSSLRRWILLGVAVAATGVSGFSFFAFLICMLLKDIRM